MNPLTFFSPFFFGVGITYTYTIWSLFKAVLESIAYAIKLYGYNLHNFNSDCLQVSMYLTFMIPPQYKIWGLLIRAIHDFEFSIIPGFWDQVQIKHF